ncbi:MAG: hypothetical protein FWG31_03615 [Oscillospiraceae bacterium]|nr:hypothetical protein [Oscillospiraceae bacterium]
MNSTEKMRENRLRRMSSRQEFMLRKSKARTWDLTNQRGYLILDAHSGFVVTGSNFNLSIDEVEKFLRGERNLLNEAKAN